LRAWKPALHQWFVLEFIETARRSCLSPAKITNDGPGFDFPQEVDVTPIYQTCSVICSEIRPPGQAGRKPAIAAQATLSKRSAAAAILPVDAPNLVS
jgi:hypothetical protein